MWKLLAAIALAAPAPALACSPVPPPDTPPTQEEIDSDLRATFAGADDLIEYVVVRSATSSRKGAVRVTRSYKGRFKPGDTLKIWTAEGAACGSGDAVRGTHGRMFVSGKAPYQYRDMADFYFQDFVRLGLAPAQ